MKRTHTSPCLDQHCGECSAAYGEWLGEQQSELPLPLRTLPRVSYLLSRDQRDHERNREG